MNGNEAKYTAKHIAKMIKRNRGIHKKARAYYDVRMNAPDMESFDKFAVSKFLEKETNKLSLQFRAFMIHNAFKKNRGFTTAEVSYLDLGENAINALKEDKVKYSQYRSRYLRQQKALKIVRNVLITDDEEKKHFEKWMSDQI